MAKHYKLYRNTSEPTTDNDFSYTADFIGHAIGDIGSGAKVISNSTRGTGNLTGFIAPQKTGVFTKYDDILIKPTGERMSFQSATGPHDLSFLQAFVEFVMETRVTKISGDTFEGLDGHKGYFLTFTADEKEQKATVTNITDSLAAVNGITAATDEGAFAAGWMDGVNSNKVALGHQHKLGI